MITHTASFFTVYQFIPSPSVASILIKCSHPQLFFPPTSSQTSTLILYICFSTTSPSPPSWPGHPLPHSSFVGFQALQLLHHVVRRLERENVAEGSEEVEQEPVEPVEAHFTHKKTGQTNVFLIGPPGRPFQKTFHKKTLLFLKLVNFKNFVQGSESYPYLPQRHFLLLLHTSHCVPRSTSPIPRYHPGPPSCQP